MGFNDTAGKFLLPGSGILDPFDPEINYECNKYGHQQSHTPPEPFRIPHIGNCPDIKIKIIHQQKNEQYQDKNSVF
jgi:hypothetical protein